MEVYDFICSMAAASKSNKIVSYETHVSYIFFSSGSIFKSDSNNFKNYLWVLRDVFEISKSIAVMGHCSCK